MFFQYSQGNPTPKGNRRDPGMGRDCKIRTPDIDENVIIEANTAAEADTAAMSKGIYFHGIAKGLDCSCCGNRWKRAEKGDGDKAPSLWGVKIWDIRPEKSFTSDYYYPVTGVAIIHYADGRRETYHANGKKFRRIIDL